MSDDGAPSILGIGGSTREGSKTELVVRLTLDAAAALGANTSLISGRELMLTPYGYDGCDRQAQALVDAVRQADGLIIGSPGYHGTVSGLTKNALDYLEELREDRPPYLTGKPVGCIATAFGWQAAVSTLGTLRQVIHALRGWPTPLGAAINTAAPVFNNDGALADSRTQEVLETVAREVVEFIVARRAACRLSQ